MNRMTNSCQLTTVAGLSLLCLPWLGLSAAVQSGLPDGKGKDTVVKVCVNCHGAEEFTALHQSKGSWTAVVDDMVGRGATGSDEELAVVVDYLATYFGKQVNVNKATVAELKSGLSLAQADAEKIVASREKNGAFQSIGDLLKIPDIDKAGIERQKTNIVF
jgi:competence ComEA-like helix-hairpin-helix protein